MFEYSTIEEALEELRQGRLILCTDDPDRENEGDFICAAQFATTENINFMAVHGKGLICMPMSSEYVKKLQFPQMVSDNTDRTSAVRDICSRCWRSRTASWSATGTPRPPWTFCVWRG